jgi:hypothetical protein
MCMKNINLDKVKDFFKSDGALRDIYFYPANKNIWQTFIDFLKGSEFRLKYSFEKVEGEIPTIDQIFDKYKLGHLLEIENNDILYCCHFFDHKIIEVDFVPETIIDQTKLNSVLNFMEIISRNLKLTSILTTEDSFDKPFLEKKYNSDFKIIKYT